MESLAQIFNFSSYFEKLKCPKGDETISKEFKDYLKKLWKDDKNTFNPKDFMKKLKKISNKKFSFKEELDPYIYFDFILKKLNLELNGIDSNITEYYNNFLIK